MKFNINLVSIENRANDSSVVIDMEGPYHSKAERSGEHIYGETLYIDGLPCHFEKYVPTDKEIERFIEDNGGEPMFAKGGYFYRLVPFAK